MSIQDDDTLRLYIEESGEHLADIENDLLAIESAGADIDEELVNKVFRAAHSIKGGAGFMGLNNIKELSHKMENVLGMIREREMVPNPEIINILLMAADVLRNLIINADASNDIDISDHVRALVSLSEGVTSDEEDESEVVDIPFPNRDEVFTISKNEISNMRKKGNFIYVVECDLINDIQLKDKTPTEFINKIEESGVILDCKIDTKSVGTLDEDLFKSNIPFVILYATILEPGMINVIFDVKETHLFVLEEDLTVNPVTESVSNEVSVSEGQEAITIEEEIQTEREESQVEDIHTVTIPVQVEEPVSDIKTTKGPTGVDTSLRVNVSLLDNLMTLAGELVLGRNQLLQAITQKDNHTIEASGQHLDLITSELQGAIMMTRMQPIGNVLNKFPRVVRDLARNLGKEVNLIIEGEGVELDKTILEAINDPLTHLVRNSVDHGLETPDERRKRGKDEVGQVFLKAFHEAGQVNIEISDDGKGMDGGKLAAAAVEKNLLSEQQAMAMSEKEKVNLIFLPGFSTAEKVSDVSGRGVGMDVVKTNLDKLGGVVDIDSTIGEGTTIRIKLPLTLAIIPSQLISTAGERYAIPQVNLEELFRIPAAQVKDRIEKVGDAEVVRLRGNLLPLIRLTDVIGLDSEYIDPYDKESKSDRRKNISDRRSKKSPLFNEDQEPESEEISLNDEESESYERGPERRYHSSSALNIVVVYTGALKYGLIVDELHDSEEIVVKPLGRDLKYCEGYAGATIMGDGRVALILDVAGLSRMANLTSLDGTDRAHEVAREQQFKNQKDVQSMLIFRNAEDEQFAAPLGLVERIEKIKRTDIEEVGGKKVLQYRGTSLPLFSIEQVANVKPIADKEDLLVIVFIVAGREIGLLATPPLDAIEESIVIDNTTLKQTGIMGSAIIRELTTLIVDIFSLVEEINPEWFGDREIVKNMDGETATILYAEDSNFFRSQVREYMEGEGYNVIEAEDGVIALDLMKKNVDKVTLLVTDIEMPNMDGFELTEKVRKIDSFSSIPIIALTTMASEEDIIRGKEVGINDYQIKLDKEKLLESIYNFLKK
ncbi:chemotaxis protein CheW [Thermodesulfobacteriota bacterium]